MAFTTDFDELGGSPTYNFRPFGSTGRRMAKIPQNKLGDLITHLFPDGETPTAISSDYPWLIAQALIVEPFASEEEKIASPIQSNLDYASVNAYDALKVTIEYGTFQAGQSEQQNEDPVLLLEHRWTAGGEFLTVPSAGLEWGDEFDVRPEVDAGFVVPTFEQQITWPRVENPPFAAIRNAIGSVNNADMVFRTGVAAPETSLFLGAEMHRTVLTSGTLAWDVTYRFSEKRVPLSGETAADVKDTIGGEDGADDLLVGGWNHFFRSEYDSDNEDSSLDIAGKTGFYRMVVRSNDSRQTSGANIYRLTDHSLLFQAG